MSVMVLFTPGCVELEETPLDFASPDNFYKSVSQIEATFASSMNRLYGEWYGYSYSYYHFENDDQIYGGDLNFDDTHGNELWRNHYRAIADINPVIKALNADVLGTTVDQAMKDELMAQAKFLRGFNYFFLVRMYGDLPLIIETTNVVSDPVSRSPITDVYALIESDLQFAVANLPVAWGGTKRGRPSQDAAKAILAKVYITMATAPLNDATAAVKARDMAKQVMDAGNYSLVPNIDEVFELTNAYGPEMMWSFNAAEDDNATPPQIWLPGTMADGWSDIKADKVFSDTYPAQPRKDAYLLLEDLDGVAYNDPTGWSWWGGAGIKKFLYDSYENALRLRSVQNYPIIRYADVLLLFAEAENMVNNGPTQAAVDAVNQIINRANGGVPNPADPLLTVGMTQEAFDAAVIHQRSLELAFEHDRWFDLVRKRILRENTLPEYQQNFSENDYLWPIPQADLRLNKDLTQNPGYTTPEQQ
jgi:starch-binding outer membrane protein, SusD/RagB family